jgi:hypothetical protein
MTFFSQARRTCGTTHFIRPCTILHATGFGLPPNFEDCNNTLPTILIQQHTSNNLITTTHFQQS